MLVYCAVKVLEDWLLLMMMMVMSLLAGRVLQEREVLPVPEVPLVFQDAPDLREVLDQPERREAR
jgi:hypothetical protein